MHLSRFYIYNPSIPYYYRSDYYQQFTESIVHVSENLIYNIFNAYDFYVISAITEQIGSHYNDRIHFLLNATPNADTWYAPPPLQWSDGVIATPDGTDGDGGQNNDPFDPPVSPNAPYYLCTGDITYNTDLCVTYTNNCACIFTGVEMTHNINYDYCSSQWNWVINASGIQNPIQISVRIYDNNNNLYSSQSYLGTSWTSYAQLPLSLNAAGTWSLVIAVYDVNTGTQIYNYTTTISYFGIISVSANTSSSGTQISVQAVSPASLGPYHIVITDGTNNVLHDDYYTIIPQIINITPPSLNNSISVIVETQSFSCPYVVENDISGVYCDLFILQLCDSDYYKCPIYVIAPSSLYFVNSSNNCTNLVYNSTIIDSSSQQVSPIGYVGNSQIPIYSLSCGANYDFSYSYQCDSNFSATGQCSIQNLPCIFTDIIYRADDTTKFKILIGVNGDNNAFQPDTTLTITNISNAPIGFSTLPVTIPTTQSLYPNNQYITFSNINSPQTFSLRFDYQNYQNILDYGGGIFFWYECIHDIHYNKHALIDTIHCDKKIKINLPQSIYGNANYDIELYDQSWNLLFSIQNVSVNTDYYIDMSGYNAGEYIVRLYELYCYTINNNTVCERKCTAFGPGGMSYFVPYYYVIVTGITNDSQGTHINIDKDGFMSQSYSIEIKDNSNNQLYFQLYTGDIPSVVTINNFYSTLNTLYVTISVLTTDGKTLSCDFQVANVPTELVFSHTEEYNPCNRMLTVDISTNNQNLLLTYQVDITDGQNILYTASATTNMPSHTFNITLGQYSAQMLDIVINVMDSNMNILYTDTSSFCYQYAEISLVNSDQSSATINIQGSGLPSNGEYLVLVFDDNNNNIFLQLYNQENINETISVNHSNSTSLSVSVFYDYTPGQNDEYCPFNCSAIFDLI